MSGRGPPCFSGLAGDVYKRQLLHLGLDKLHSRRQRGAVGGWLGRGRNRLLCRKRESNPAKKERRKQLSHVHDFAFLPWQRRKQGISPCYRRGMVNAAKTVLLLLWTGEGRLGNAGFGLIGLLLLGIEECLHILVCLLYTSRCV